MSEITLAHVQEFFTEDTWGDDYDEDTARFPDGISEFFYEHKEGSTFTIEAGGQEWEATIIEKFDDGHEWTNHKHLVFQVGEKFFKFPGVFYSHDGDYWEPEQITEVRPTQKVIQVWE